MTGRYVEAGRFWRWFLTRYGLAGIVMPIPFRPTCYYLPPWHKSPEFIRHENTHFRQIARMGSIPFAFAYLYYLARYGYRNSPLEREAYGQEDKAPPEAHSKAQGQEGVLSHG